MKRFIKLFFVIIASALLIGRVAQAEDTPTAADVENEYGNLAKEADRRAVSGDYQGSIDMLQKLIDNPQLPVVDRAMMELNKAILLGKMEKPAEAIESFDKAASQYTPEVKSYVLEMKAVYLNSIGRSQESMVIYQSLLKEGNISAEDQERITKNIATIAASLK